MRLQYTNHLRYFYYKMNDSNNDSNKDYNIYNFLKLRELYMKRSTWIRDFNEPKKNISVQFYGAACSGSLKNKK